MMFRKRFREIKTFSGTFPDIYYFKGLEDDNRMNKFEK